MALAGCKSLNPRLKPLIFSRNMRASWYFIVQVSHGNRKAHSREQAGNIRVTFRRAMHKTTSWSISHGLCRIFMSSGNDCFSFFLSFCYFHTCPYVLYICCITNTEQFYALTILTGFSATTSHFLNRFNYWEINSYVAEANVKDKYT